MGYWDAKFGESGAPGIAGNHGLGIQKELRERMLEMCLDKYNYPGIVNTRFKQLKCRLYAWTTQKADRRHSNEQKMKQCCEIHRSSARCKLWDSSAPV